MSDHDRVLLLRVALSLALALATAVVALAEPEVSGTFCGDAELRRCFSL
jgi:hypothetical protein